MTSDVFSTFDAEVKKRHNEMLVDLDSINEETLKSEGVTLSFGGKTFKFTDLQIIDDESLEVKIRNEFKEKINERQQRIRDKINQKINQLLLMHQNKQQEMERKEQQLRDKYEKAAMMPDINESHMLKGLSVVKGRQNDQLIWIYRAVYNPRFVIVYSDSFNNRKKKFAIPERLVSRMKSEMLILIHTRGSSVTSIATKKSENNGNHSLEDFPHYHQQGGGDCWGKWSYERKWNTPDDIIKLAKDAESVLETVNGGSLAQRGPAGLPRYSTLEKSVKDLDEYKPQTEERRGGSNVHDDVWQTM